NLPIRVGENALYAYLGARLPPLEELVRPANAFGWSADPAARAFLRRFGASHAIWDRPAESAGAAVLYAGPDLALDQLAYRPPGSPAHATWTLLRLPDPFPPARVARLALAVQDARELIAKLALDESPDHVWHLRSDVPADFPPERASVARLVEWDGVHARVDHDGPCELVITRTFYPGWTARAQDGAELLIYRADGGIQAVRIPGSGTTLVTVRFEPTGLARAGLVSAAAAILAELALICWAARAWLRWRRTRNAAKGT
ncbi:MAG TPA: hypothetical protein VGY53_05640, partial [Isosphaeraceae bacterium]|nr:hypothetical protein [Isosphaeraceae bacterium]